MNATRTLLLTVFVALLTSACFNKNSPNYQYFPDMYEAVGYETYAEVGFLPENTAALTPAENTIPRGWLPYEFDNTPAGKSLAREDQGPLLAENRSTDLAKGKELYDVYCAICHGAKGDGQGHLVKREKILGVPSYADQARNINIGSTYHTIYYGLNSMGSYASQLTSEEEIWQISAYVMELKNDLTN
jgi:mono/diheme cytochrome c family protein